MNLNKFLNTDFISILLAILLGILIGAVWRPLHIVEKETITEEKVVTTDQRIQECEKQGGEFSLRRHWDAHSYYARCEIPTKEIFKLEIPIEK